MFLRERTCEMLLCTLLACDNTKNKEENRFENLHDEIRSCDISPGPTSIVFQKYFCKILLESV